MQSSRFSSFPTVHPSFQRHRKSIDHSRFPLNLRLCSANHTPIWASLPTPPMSGSPPPEPSRDPAQFAGHRRKRSDTPPTATTTPTISTLPALVEHRAPRYGEQPVGETRYEGPTMQIAHQPVPYLPRLTYGAGPGAPIAHYPTPDLAPPQQQISPRTTRKTKAHVASACINCKRKHLRCDNSRPCRRCLQSGKEDTCKDVEHKKRGRPPLKPEDPSVINRRGHGSAPIGLISDASRGYHGHDSRSYAPSNYPPILPNAPPSMYGHHRAGSRTSLYGGIQSPYALPTVAPTPLTATVSGFSYATRPASTTSTVSTQPTSPYVPQPPYGMQGMSRGIQPYSGYPFQPVDLPPTTQPMYSNPIFPREQHHAPMHVESQYSQGLQLPPIRPAQQSAFNLHLPQQRQSVQHQQQQQHHHQQQPQQTVRQQGQRRDSGERDPKRPKMDIQGILGPKND